MEAFFAVAMVLVVLGFAAAVLVAMRYLGLVGGGR